ncbi:hypothetical protein NSQ61_19805 [Aeribacillus sp. FSL K6-1121]|uniref:hypothetical protein n=1 Tax=Aeribacillus sp. FSL K6-1121 TaxID=2954745 RepID=UPI0030FBF8E9
MRKKKFSFSHTQAYLFTLSFFGLCFFSVFISPIFTGKSYSFEDATLNEYDFLTNTTEIALVKKEYNPDRQLMRLDFSLREATADSKLSNMEYEIESKYITDSSKKLKTKIIRVDDNYLVVFVKNIPEGFSVLSTTIFPKYIHPEIEVSNDLQDRSFKIYVKESDKIINNSLAIQSKDKYQKEYISFEQDLVRNEIQKKLKEIKNREIAISDLSKSISNLETDINYQTESEKLETNNQINSHKTKISQYEDEIDTLKNEVEDLKQKILLLEKKKVNF